MKKFLYTFFTITFIISMFECSKNSTDSVSKFSVSGIIYYQGHTIANASVSIDNEINYSTQTDNNGYFAISDVDEGNHEIIIQKSFNDGSFVESNSDLIVNEDIILNSLILPKAVILQAPKNVTDESISLSWTMSNANDFREYKLYRHNTSGLDETTGTLVHVSTSINDTSFTDHNLSPSSPYYYRVYIMNDYGRLGGSNIVSDTTENKNYIWNGDFEDNSNLLSWWYDWGGIGTSNYTDSMSVLGSQSLMMIADSIFNNGNYILAILYHQFNDLEPDRNYKLSFWCKTHGNHSEYGGDLWGYRPEKAGIMAYGFITNNVIGIPENTDWTYLETTFYLDSQRVNDFNIYLQSSSEYAWFDDVRLELLE